MAGSGPLHIKVVSAVSRRPLNRANALSFLSLQKNNGYLVYRLRYSPISPHFLAPAFPMVFSFLLFCICRRHIFLISSYALPCFLDSTTSPYSSSPFFYCLRYSSINHAWPPLVWHTPSMTVSSHRYHVSICLEFVHSQVCSQYCITRPS